MFTHTPREERGASAVEYALLIVGIAAILAVVVYALGGLTDSMFTQTCTEIDSRTSSSGSC